MNREQLAEFISARHTRWMRAAIILGVRPSDADDVAQEVALRLWVHARGMRAVEFPDSYATTVLVREVARTRRRSRRGREVPDLTAGDPPIDPDTSMALLNAIRSLSIAHREVLVLRFYMDLTETQSAEVLGVPQGTLKSRTARAVAALGSHPTIRSLQEGLR